MIITSLPHDRRSNLLTPTAPARSLVRTSVKPNPPFYLPSPPGICRERHNSNIPFTLQVVIPHLAIPPGVSLWRPMISILHCSCPSTKVARSESIEGTGLAGSTLPGLVHLHSHNVLVRTLYGFANLELGWAKSKNTHGNQGGFWTLQSHFTERVQDCLMGCEI